MKRASSHGPTPLSSVTLLWGHTVTHTHTQSLLVPSTYWCAPSPGPGGPGPVEGSRWSTHRRLGHVPPQRDVLAVLLVGHADPLLGDHLVFSSSSGCLLLNSSRCFFFFFFFVFFLLVSVGAVGLGAPLSCRRPQKYETTPPTRPLPA